MLSYQNTILISIELAISVMEHKLNIKFVEILANLVYEQNKQLLQIIAEEQKLSYKKVINILPTQYQIKKNMASITNGDQRAPDTVLREKSNSISESSEPSVSSDSDVE